MLGLLQRLIGLVISPVLTWIADWISGKLQKYFKMKSAEQKIEEANQQVLDKTVKAETKEERDAAAEEVIRNL